MKENRTFRFTRFREKVKPSAKIYDRKKSYDFLDNEDPFFVNPNSGGGDESFFDSQTGGRAQQEEKIQEGCKG